MNSLFSFSQLALNWYHLNGRKNLPWKIKENPYNIWIAEVMLQQTQVNTVIPYYQKFINNFPNINILEKSSINKILNIWSGLGYYRRAHNIYYTAKIIVNKFNSVFPNNFYNIIKLPGIGRTTAGAILSFGFNFYACILDGNIKRVLLRYFKIHANTKNEIERKLWAAIELVTPIYNTNKFNQAIMDIGSLICLKSKPKCNICPLNQTCMSLSNNDWSTYPINVKKKIISKKNIFLLIIQYKNYIFLNKNKLKNIWKGLYYFPIFHNQLEVLIWKKNNNIKIKNQKIFSSFLHKISNLQLFCIPIWIEIKDKFCIHKIQNAIWFDIIDPQYVGIPFPIKKIIKNISRSFLQNKKDYIK
ncbi:A/G-specific adenine glycosylase [Buchnera aphidicola]|uniref:Adenine DNA glycosylase n=1 Tax=Buchnera aphidicola subsp. Melaphis rhois TaxID=118103 RepID=A0A4D6Y3H1_BUCMH|nr:A/G-specific adenine glycosylase [Buchnera aphidicola]QCI23509.1 A/G-specific adenine glycosylase [Buchnera aphidicola (Melaphis rhois)]